MKFGFIIFRSSYLSTHQKYITSFKKGFLPTIGLVFLAFGLIMLQPDLGTGVVLVLTCGLMIFIAGARLLHFFGLSIIGLAGFVFLIVSAPYRIQRITSFLDPWSDPLGSGFQIIQSLYAIGPSGIFGFGFGQSRQKYFYLPEPQTDFIFSVIVEETGFIGGAFILIVFCIMLWRAISIASGAPD